LRFAREVAAARTVSPLYTAAVVDADTEADLPWLATTYIDGPSLEELVQERGPMAPGPVLPLAGGLAEALAPGPGAPPPPRHRRGARLDPRGRAGAPRPQAEQRAPRRLRTSHHRLRHR